MSAAEEPWVSGPDGLRCGACQCPVALTTRNARPVSRCTNADCGLIVLGAYDLRLDERANRHPAVRAHTARSADPVIDTLLGG